MNKLDTSSWSACFEAVRVGLLRRSLRHPSRMSIERERLLLTRLASFLADLLTNKRT